MKRNKLSRLSARVTVARVAAECGVSVMTASRALNNAPSVAEPTRLRILHAAETLGYRLQPGYGRPRLITDKVRPVVDVILGTTLTAESLFYTRLLFAIEQALSRHRHDCVIRTCNGRYEDFLSLCETLRGSDATGHLFVGYLPVKQIQALLELDPHMILVDYTGDPRLHGPYEYVGFDTLEAVRLAVRHLWEKGRRRIALVRGPLAHHFARETEKGYIETLAELGQTVDRHLVLEADFTAENARRVLSAAMADGLVFDAVFTNDEMATGVLRALYERDRCVPADVAVVGCDGLSLGLQTIPRLTTVMLDYEQMGQVAVERLFSGREKNAPVFRVRFVPTIVIRESS